MVNENTQETVIQSFTFKGEGDKIIHANKWLPPANQLRAVLIINHGMAEHIRRYNAFAHHLVELGFAVYGEDHRGHGMTAGEDVELGFFADEDGWMKIIGDIRSLHLLIMEDHKSLPVFIMGHSMGSFLTRHYLSLYGSELKGAIISGTGNQRASLLNIAKFISWIETLIRGSRHKSKFLDKLSFGSYNRPFKQVVNTGFEWLSSDQREVQKYVEDPYCGFVSTAGLYRDLFWGLRIISRKQCFCSTPQSLPLLIISGKDDPVGDKGRGVEVVASKYKDCGIKDLTLLLKENMRHECLNEINRDECYNNISEWLTSRLTG